MAGIVERRVSAAGPWSRRLASFAAMLFVVSGLGHRYGAVETVAFLWLLGLVGALAIAALCAAAVGFSDLWEHGARGGRDSTFGTLMALVVLAPFLVSGWRFYAYPRLTDVSTDLIAPPQLPLAARERAGAMNPIVPPTPSEIDLQIDAYPEVTGRRYEAAPDRVLEAILAEARLRGWSVRSAPSMPVDAVELTVEAVAYSFFLGFPADVAIRLTDETATTYVDMRSVSRYARHDLGDNARRVANFLAALDTALKGQPLE